VGEVRSAIMPDRVDVYIYCILIGGWVVVSWWKRLHGTRRRGHETFSSIAGHQAALGSVFVLLVLLLRRGLASYAEWAHLGGGLALGGLLGLLLSNRATKRLEARFAAQEGGLVLPKPSRLERSSVIVLTLVIGITVALLPHPRFLVVWLRSWELVVVGGLGGFLVGLGLSNWFWAKQKERRGFGPVTTPWT
jgi:hypothetical protein